MHFEDSRTLAASPEALWPLVADTERINRSVGAPRVHFSPAFRPGGGTATIAEYRLGPVAFARWTEEPFQWAAPRFYDVERRYHWGPIASFRGGMELTPTAAQGTTVRVWADLEPRGPLGWLVVQAVGRYGIARGVRQVDQFGHYLGGTAESPFPRLQRGHLGDEGPETPARRLSRAPWDRLTNVGASPELVHRLRQHLEHSPDLDVLDMRPLFLADIWHAPRLDVLGLFLHAARAGIVVLHWDLLCPHCRKAKASYATLDRLQPQAVCATCAATYQADFDRNVEARFDVAPRIRVAQAATYCEGGPMNTPHRVARRTVAPDGIAALQSDLAPGRYRVVSRQSQGSVLLEAGVERVPSLSSRVVSMYPDRMGPENLAVPPGSLSLSLVSHLSVATTVDLEEADWPDTIATAALVSTLGTFRDLFSTDVLAAGQQVAIGRLTFLALTIAEPAALYASLGQGRAFKLIEACLRSAASIIGAHHGAVSGTLGESLIATFSAADDGVAAAIMLQRATTAIVGEAGVDTARLMKVGVHEGPCLAATVADRLGYFGTTPGATLRLLEFAQGGEIMVSATVMADPDVLARLGGENLGHEAAELLLADGLFHATRLGLRTGRAATIRGAQLAPVA